VRGVLLLLLSLPLMAQEAPRERVRKLNDAAYRMDEVKEHCTSQPDSSITVEVEGEKVPVDCGLWYIWWEAELKKEG